MMMYWLIEIMKVEWLMVCKKVKVVGEEEESGERSERSVLSLEESERLSERWSQWRSAKELDIMWTGIVVGHLPDCLDNRLIAKARLAILIKHRAGHSAHLPLFTAFRTTHHKHCHYLSLAHSQSVDPVRQPSSIIIINILSILHIHILL